MTIRFARSPRSALLALAALLVSLAGCGETHTPGADAGTDAGGIVFDLDGAMFDSGVDAPIEPVTIGEACTADTDCPGDGAICISDPGLLPGGYCSLACDPMGGDPMCPTGSTCLEIGRGQAFCFRDCDPTATSRECRAGYGCASNPMVPSVCLGGCTDDTDCPSGLMCDPLGGFSGSGTCFDPSAGPGDPCAMDTDCGAGAFCFSEDASGVPGGACFGECDVATNAGCETGACFPAQGTGLCAAGCTTDADCRDAYACTPVPGVTGRSYCAADCTTDADCTISGFVCNVGTGTCAEPFDPTRLGQTCSNFGGTPCPGGPCFSERAPGCPGAYCAYAGCGTVGTACGAESGGVCVPSPTGSATNYCFDDCTTDTDCRAGYACRPSDASNPTSPGACFPACTDTAQCTGMTRTCDPTSGLCR